MDTRLNGTYRQKTKPCDRIDLFLTKAVGSESQIAECLEARIAEDRLGCVRR